MHSSPTIPDHRSPTWPAIGATVGALSATWICLGWAGRFRGAEVLAIVCWPLLCALIGTVLTILLRYLDVLPWRVALVAGALMLGEHLYGLPTAWNLVGAAAVGYGVLKYFGRAGRKQRVQLRHRATDTLLDQFKRPLWARLELSNVVVQWVVESTHRGYPSIVVELEHQGVGLFDESSDKDRTTVFVLRLPERSKHWSLPAERIRASRQTCVDEQFVYTATVSRRVGQKEWPAWFDMAAAAADEVQRLAAQRRLDGAAVPPPMTEGYAVGPPMTAAARARQAEAERAARARDAAPPVET